MKKFTLSFLLLVLSMLQTFPATSGEPAVAVLSVPKAYPATIPMKAVLASTHKVLTIATYGEPSNLHLENSTLTFCDKRGGRKLDIETGRNTALDRICSNNEPNTVCNGLGIDVDVRGLLSEPNDIVDLAGWSIPLKGRVHDCAADGKVIAIVTASIVILVDVEKKTTKEISQHGGDRITIDSGWVVWSALSKLYVVPRKA